MKKQLKWLLMGLMMAGVALVFGRVQHVQAAGSPFVLTVGEASNTRNSNSGYYDLLVKPNQQQTLKFTIKSVVNTDQNVTVRATNANTGLNGGIGYSDTTDKPDKSMKYPFTTFAPKSTTIPLKAGETKNVTWKFVTPNANVQGMILGGLLATSDYTDDGGQKGNVQFKNQFAYAVAVAMSFQNPIKVKPDLQWQQVVPMVTGTRAVAQISFLNPQPNYFNQGTVKTTISALSGDKKSATTTVKDFSVAPNTRFNYQIALPYGQRLVAGDYRIRMRVDTMSGYSWTFDKKFTISQQTADRLNKKLGIKPDNTWMWWVIGGLILILVILGFVIVYRMGTKKGKKNEA